MKTLNDYMAMSYRMEPFLPFSSEKVRGWLNVNLAWEPASVPFGYQLPEVEILFQRIDKKVIEIESEKLKAVLEGNG